MAIKPRRSRPKSPNGTRNSGAENGGGNDGLVPGTTGRYLILFHPEAAPQGARRLASLAGLKVASTADFAGGAVATRDLGGADALMFPDLGVAVAEAPRHQLRAMQAADDSGILAIEPERVVYAIEEVLADSPVTPAASLPYPGRPTTMLDSDQAAISLEFLRGYREAVNHLYDSLSGVAAAGSAATGAALSEAEVTWGLQLTKVAASRYTGAGIRVAILDTGLDLNHPDLAGRNVVSQSFIQGQAVQDGHGHGTHVTGTACGPQRPGTLPRYGIAPEADIYIGKVLSNEGSGADAGILAGIQWALSNGCAIISMSLGAPTQIGQTYSTVFEHVAHRVLDAGTIIVAAAGNESHRPQQIAPVGHPANCPSIMAVGALDQQLQIASFSCRGLNPEGGQVDIAGPGVAVRSSWPRPRLYNTISGTSMATPHVAGIAALWAQANRSYRGRALLSVLGQSAKRLTLSAADVGAGLVQAP